MGFSVMNSGTFKNIGHYIVFLPARFIARNRQLANVAFDRCNNFYDVAKSGLNHIAFLFRLPKTFFITSLMLELTNYCNLKCSFCANSKIERKRGYMNKNLIERIIKSHQNLQYVYLYDWGEPLLHPEIISIIKMIREAGKRTFLTTNGTLLNSTLSKQLIAAGLSTIAFSIDGLNETYTMLRGFDYKSLEEKIIDFLEIKNRINSQLRVEINFVISEKTETQVREFRKIWEKRVDYINFQPMVTYKKLQRKFPCRELWKGNLVVLWDGKVVPCCVDYNGELCIGEADKDDLVNVLNSPAMIKLRQSHSKKDFFAICNYCSEYVTDVIDSRFNGRLAK